MSLIFGLKIVLSVSFGIAGFLALLGLPPFKKLFKDFRLNRFAMILVGLIDLVGVVMLFHPLLDFYAAIILAYLTTAAIFKHIKVKHSFKKYIPAALLLILSMALALMLMNRY